MQSNVFIREEPHILCGYNQKACHYSDIRTSLLYGSTSWGQETWWGNWNCKKRCQFLILLERGMLFSVHVCIHWSMPLNTQDLRMIRMAPSFVLLSHIQEMERQAQRARAFHLEALIRRLREHTDDISMLLAHISSVGHCLKMLKHLKKILTSWGR